MTSGTHLQAALAYAKRGWPIFPMNVAKKPLSEHGFKDATTDPSTIASWWVRHPAALVALATGRPSGVIVLDVDIRPAGSGLESLERLGIATHPTAPTAHSPSGGFHLFFAAPAHEVRSSTAKLGPFLDVRADGGSIILPPGPGRYWDPVLNLETTPLPPIPDWMVAQEIAKPNAASRVHRDATLSRYGEVTLDRAVKCILNAPAGQQETTLNREVFSIARLAGSNEIPPGLALDALLLAARHMPTLDARRPWSAAELEWKVKNAFTDGLRKPKVAANG